LRRSDEIIAGLRLPELCFLLAVMIVCSGVYILHAGDFFLFDSRYALADNQWLNFDANTLEGWRVATFGTAAGPLGRPLSNFSFALSAALEGGVSAAGMKLGNIVIHCLTGLAVMFFLRLILSASPSLQWGQDKATAVALLAVAIWMLHPLQVSTVLYAVQRMTELSSLFVIAGLLVFFRLRVQWLQRLPAAEEVSLAVFYVFLFSLLAAFSKENGLLLPWLLAITELCLFRFRIAGIVCSGYRNITLLLLLAPVAVLLAVLLFSPELVQQAYEHRDFSLSERVLTQLRVLWLYLSWLVVPLPSSMGFHHDDLVWSRSFFDLAVLVAVAAWLLVFWLSWKLRERAPLLAFATLWYLLAHSMESSVLALEMVFEHRNYLPSIAVCVLLAQLLWWLSQALKVRLRILAVASVALIALLLFIRSSYWHGELGLAEHHYSLHPDSERSRLHLASVYQDAALVASDPALAQRYLIAARELSHRSYLAQKNSIRALILLIHFDANSSNAERAEQWLQELQRAVFASDRIVLTVGEINFLVFYSHCVVAGDCPAPAQGQGQFLRKLAQHYARQPQAWLMLIDYCLRRGDADCARGESEALLLVHPGYREALESIYQAALISGDIVRRHLHQPPARLDRRPRHMRRHNQIRRRQERIVVLDRFGRSHIRGRRPWLARAQRIG
jgi:hypothetical protein